MVTFELIEFIKEQLENGVSQQAISEALRAKGGWKDEHIEHALFLAQYGHHITSTNDDVVE